ncbi:hypothetical protein COB52_02860 [Candidatus Kaiserbacteria bacterium]|nr:MAG: hypothetical protein COB52_02860 [Candidatus Kaiserbacteria bacterium]
MSKENDLIYTIHKSVGETPLQAIEKSREERDFPSYLKMAYAGRLDPMAEGKLLVLTGEKCKRIKEFWNLDKEYKVSIVLGLSSDSHDVLGKLTYKDEIEKIDEERIKKALKSYIGTYSWPYPVISSKPVNGKPLFQWFLEGKLDEIDIPESTGDIFKIEVTGVRSIKPEELKKRTLEKIHALAIVTDESKRLGRDFRRHEVIDSWNTWYKTSANELQVIDIVCSASAGTYMRTLANEVGKKLGTGGLALEINRTKVGKYKWGIWWRKY